MSRSQIAPARSARSMRPLHNVRNVRNSRNTVAPSALQLRLAALVREARWILFAALAFWLALVLASWSAQDPGWLNATAGVAVSNSGGAFGAHVADLLLLLFGYAAWLWVLLLVQRVGVGFVRLRRVLKPGVRSGISGIHPAKSQGAALNAEHGEHGAEPFVLPRIHWECGIGFVVLLASSMGLIAMQWPDAGAHLPGGSGGELGKLLAALLQTSLGMPGSMVLLLAGVATGTSLFFSFSWLLFSENLGRMLETGVRRLLALRAAREDRRLGQTKQAQRQETVVSKQEQLTHDHAVRIEPAITSVPKSERVTKEKQKNLFADLLLPAGASPLPPLDLLDSATNHVEGVSAETIAFTSRLIEKKLSDFGVKVTVISAQAGPVITRYEIEPDTGVKGSQIVNLAKDLARALSLVSLRVVETIPGKNLMGLELPNPKRQMVKLSEIIGSKTYHSSPSSLTLALGKDIAGNPIVADLAKMPHLLVAGTTGSGKSVGINAMILSMLYKSGPQQVRLIMIDPKMLEMSVYEGIPHLLAPVVTDMRQAANALNWCVAEMEKRYRLMSKLGVRNLAGYNHKIREAQKRGTPIPNPFSLTPDAPEPLDALPTIVVVIDELADMMMVVGKKIEELIARLAQKARAAGIHLILATQRPSVDVITGLIKANIPTRIAFQVSSKIDSRTILDQMGAEALLGQGDMLYMPPGSGLPTRVHGAFVHDDEVHRVAEHLKAQGEPDYLDGLLEGEIQGETGDGVGSVTGFSDPESDPLYDQAVQVVLKNRKASISSVQRHLRIGYNRAARLLEQMEQSGLVSALQANGNREILVPAGESGHAD